MTFTGLYCARCGDRQQERHAGKRCIKCGSIGFANTLRLVPWPKTLTYNDRRFLKSLQIAST